MIIRERNLRGPAGCLLGILVIVVFLSFAALGVLLLLGRLPFRHQILAFWQDWFLKPVFWLVASIIIWASGKVILSLAGVGVAQYLVNRLFLWGPQWLMWLQSTRQLYAVDQDLAQEHLRNMFGDDLQNVAVYMDKLEIKVERKPKRVLAFLSVLGIIFLSLWSTVGLILPVLFNLAFFESIQRLFAWSEAPQALLEDAGSLAPSLAPYLPLHFAGLIPGFRWNGALLVILVAALSLFYWYAMNLSTSGWILPKIRWSFLLLSLLVLIVFFSWLGQVLLVYALLTTMIVLLEGIFTRWVVKGIILHLYGLLYQFRKALSS